jgi:hypothetical protein
VIFAVLKFISSDSNEREKRGDLLELRFADEEAKDCFFFLISYKLSLQRHLAH